MPRIAALISWPSDARCEHTGVGASRTIKRGAVRLPEAGPAADGEPEDGAVWRPADAGEVSRFRAMTFAGTQPTTGAVNTIPPMDYGIVWGHDHHQWSFGDNSRMIGWIPQASGTNAGGPPLAASNLGWGVDLWGVNIRQQACRSTGFAVQGDGGVNIGTGSITPTPEGITIDAKGQYVNGVSVAEPGRGYKPGEYLHGTQGDIYIVATVSPAGGVTALGIVGVGYAGHPAANPLAVTGGSGQGRGQGWRCNGPGQIRSP